jgi:hypothetical protein
VAGQPRPCCQTRWQLASMAGAEGSMLGRAMQPQHRSLPCTNGWTRSTAPRRPLHASRRLIVSCGSVPWVPDVTSEKRVGSGHFSAQKNIGFPNGYNLLVRQTIRRGSACGRARRRTRYTLLVWLTPTRPVAARDSECGATCMDALRWCACARQRAINARSWLIQDNNMHSIPEYPPPHPPRPPRPHASSHEGLVAVDHHVIGCNVNS